MLVRFKCIGVLYFFVLISHTVFTVSAVEKGDRLRWVELRLQFKTTEPSMGRFTHTHSRRC